jgi:hypothetical protein
LCKAAALANKQHCGFAEETQPHRRDLEETIALRAINVSSRPVRKHGHPPCYITLRATI